MRHMAESWYVEWWFCEVEQAVEEGTTSHDDKDSLAEWLRR